MQTLLENLGFSNPVRMYGCPWQENTDARVSVFVRPDSKRATFCVPQVYGGKGQIYYYPWSEWGSWREVSPEMLVRWQGPVMPQAMGKDSLIIPECSDCAQFVIAVSRLLWPERFSARDALIQVAKASNKILDANGEPAEFVDPNDAVVDMLTGQMTYAARQLGDVLYWSNRQVRSLPLPPLPAWIGEMEKVYNGAAAGPKEQEFTFRSADAKIAVDKSLPEGGTLLAMLESTARGVDNSVAAWWLNNKRLGVSPSRQQVRLQASIFGNSDIEEKKAEEEKPEPRRKFFLIAE